MPNVIYTGPSMIDGSPIVALATIGSRNMKTGALVQTFIMRADIEPHLAIKTGDDSSVCGSCPRRHYLGGDCYVNVHQAPLSAWRAWDRAGRPSANLWEACCQMESEAKGFGLRMGSYGDPMAVPFDVWRTVIDSLTPNAVTGYTHRWQDSFEDPAHVAWFRDNVMASCDNAGEAALARSKGWRYFLAIPQGSAIPERTIECLSDKLNKTCVECGICDGAQGKASRVSVYIKEHGVRAASKAKRSAALAVI